MLRLIVNYAQQCSMDVHFVSVVVVVCPVKLDIFSIVVPFASIVPVFPDVLLVKVPLNVCYARMNIIMKVLVVIYAQLKFQAVILVYLIVYVLLVPVGLHLMLNLVVIR